MADSPPPSLARVLKDVGLSPNTQAPAPGPSDNPPSLHLGQYKRQAKCGQSGISANFRLTPYRHGTVYQAIEMRYTLGGDVRLSAYTEAWVAERRRRRLDQGGADSFLVPDADVAADPGSLDIHALAWFEPGKIALGFARGRRAGDTARSRDRNRPTKEDRAQGSRGMEARRSNHMGNPSKRATLRAPGPAGGPLVTSDLGV